MPNEIFKPALASAETAATDAAALDEPPMKWALAVMAAHGMAPTRADGAWLDELHLMAHAAMSIKAGGVGDTEDSPIADDMCRMEDVCALAAANPSIRNVTPSLALEARTHHWDEDTWREVAETVYSDPDATTGDVERRTWVDTLTLVGKESIA